MTISILVLLPNATFATKGWGKIINTLAQTDIETQIKLPFGILKKITTFYSPFEAFALSFLLNWSTACFLGLTLLLVNLKFNRRIGLVTVGIILFLICW